MFFLFLFLICFFAWTVIYRRRFSVTKIQSLFFVAVLFLNLSVDLFANSSYNQLAFYNLVSLIHMSDWNSCNINSCNNNFRNDNFGNDNLDNDNSCNDNSFTNNSGNELTQSIPDYETFLAQSKRNKGGCLWGNLYYSNTTLEPKNSSTKIKPDDFGFQIGLDVLTAHEVYSTFILNINESKTKFHNNTKSTIDNIFFSYVKVYHWQVAHAGFGAGVGYDRYSLSSQGHKTSGNGLQTRLDGELGLSFIFKWWEIKPFYALQYDFLYHGKINSSSNYFAGDWNGHSLKQFLGIRLNWKPLENVLLFQSRITWVHELLDDTPQFYALHFSSIKGKGASTPSIFFFDGNIGRDWVWVGFGVKWSLLYQRSLFVDYDAMVNSRQVTHLVNLGLCLGW